VRHGFRRPVGNERDGVGIGLGGRASPPLTYKVEVPLRRRFQHAAGGLAGERIAAVVVPVAGVPFHLVPADRVPQCCRAECLPQALMC
jgi:hypothetical protein